MSIEDTFVMMTKEVASFSLFLNKYFVLIMKVKTHWKVKTSGRKKKKIKIIHNLTIKMKIFYVAIFHSNLQIKMF